MSSLKKVLKGLGRFALDLVFPILCQSCGREGAYLCLVCQAKISPAAERCFACEAPSPLGQTHADCRKQTVALRGLMVAADYDNASIKNLIWNLKYNSVKPIADVLALLMTDYLAKRELLDYFANSAVIPVPLHQKRQRQRGFNQSELIAQSLARNLRLDYLPILKKLKRTDSQVDLPKAKRLTNLQGVFEAESTPSLGERKILLIDDVSSTGATLNECALILQTQQPAEIWGLVVARN